ARLVSPTAPVRLAYGEDLPKLLVLVSNPTPVAREVHVEAFAFGEDKTLLSKYSLSENVRPGDSALIKEGMEPCHTGFTEISCSVGAIQVRALAGEPVSQSRSISSCLRLSDTEVASLIELFR